MRLEHGPVTCVLCDLCNTQSLTFHLKSAKQVTVCLEAYGWYVDDDVQACPSCHAECEGDYDYDTIIESPLARAALNGNARGGK